eukprot:ctg_35.g104
MEADTGWLVTAWSGAVCLGAVALAWRVTSGGWWRRSTDGAGGRCTPRTRRKRQRSVAAADGVDERAACRGKNVRSRESARHTASALTLSEADSEAWTENPSNAVWDAPGEEAPSPDRLVPPRRLSFSTVPGDADATPVMVGRGGGRWWRMARRGRGSRGGLRQGRERQSYRASRPEAEKNKRRAVARRPSGPALPRCEANRREGSADKAMPQHAAASLASGGTAPKRRSAKHQATATGPRRTSHRPRERTLRARHPPAVVTRSKRIRHSLNVSHSRP